jgi:hypothetical protein
MTSLKQTTPEQTVAADIKPDQPAESNIDPLARLSSYRHAAQAIRRRQGKLGDRLKRLVTLMQQARAESDQFIREFAQQIIWAQAEWMLQGGEALLRNRTRSRLETAARRLRADGYECCPRCEQRLSDPADWSFWAALRRAELDRLQALERGEAA